MLTVTAAPAELLEFPAASNALAVYVCEPSLMAVVSSVALNGAAVTVAHKVVPSHQYSTLLTPTLSDAEQVRFMVPLIVLPEVGAVRVTLGAVVSDTGLQADSQPFVMEGIQVVRPLEQEIFTTVETNFVSWVSVDDPGPFTLLYIKNGVETNVITSGISGNSFDWYPAEDTNPV